MKEKTYYTDNFSGTLIINDASGNDNYNLSLSESNNTVNIHDKETLIANITDESKLKELGRDTYTIAGKDAKNSNVTIKDEFGIDAYNINNYDGKLSIRDLAGDDNYNISNASTILTNSVVTIEDEQGEDEYIINNFNGILTIDDYGLDNDIYRFTGHSCINENGSLTWPDNSQITIVDEGGKNEYHINTTGGATYSITDKGRESIIYFGSNDEQIVTSYEPEFWQTLGEDGDIWVYKNKWAFKRIYSGYSDDYKAIYDLQIMSLADANIAEGNSKKDAIITLKDFKDGDFGIYLSDDLYLPSSDSESYDEMINDQKYDLYIDGDDAKAIDDDGMITITFNLKDFLLTADDIEGNPYKYRDVDINDLVNLKDINPEDYALMLRMDDTYVPIGLGEFSVDKDGEKKLYTFKMDEDNNVTLRLKLGEGANIDTWYRDNGAQGRFNLCLELLQLEKEEDKGEKEDKTLIKVPLKDINTFVYKTDDTQTDGADFIWLGDKPDKSNDKGKNVQAGMRDYVLGSAYADEFSLQIMDIHRADKISLEEYTYSLGYRLDENGEESYQADATFVGNGGEDTYKVERGQFIHIEPAFTNITDLQDTIVFGAGLSKKDFRMVRGDGSKIMMKFLNSRTLVTIDEFFFKGIKNIIIAGQSYAVEELGIIDKGYQKEHSGNLIKNEDYKIASDVFLEMLHSSHLKKGVFHGSSSFEAGWKITDIQLVGGGQLPESITYDPVQDALLYKATHPINQKIGLTFTITDKYGVTSYIDRFFELDFNIVENTAPYASESLKDHLVTYGEEFIWQLPDGSFTDDEAGHGDELIYSLKMKDGSRIPKSLSINKITGEITGSLPEGITGYELIIVATDKGGLSGEQTLNIFDNQLLAGNMRLMEESTIPSTHQESFGNALLTNKKVYTQVDQRGIGSFHIDTLISVENTSPLSEYKKAFASDGMESLQNTLRDYDQFFVKEQVTAPAMSQKLHSLINAMAVFDAGNNERDFMVTSESSLTQPLLISSY